MLKDKKIKIRSKIIILILIITIIPVLLITYFFANNFLSYLREQNQEHYLTLMEQVSININYEIDRYKKNIDELFINQDFRTALFDKQFYTALDEIQYDEELGVKVRENLIGNIEGDISIVQFDRKSILENTPVKSTKYSLGQYRLDISRLMIDPLYVFLQENPEKSYVVGSFNNDVLIGYESEKKAVLVYPVRNNTNRISKLFIIILQNDYFTNLYSHLHKLNFGTLFITDFAGNLISINHPSIYDYYTYDKKNRMYTSEEGANYRRSDHFMTLEDYNNLILDPAVLRYPEILEFLVDSGLETPFLTGSKTGRKNISVSYKGSNYYTVGRVDLRTEMKFLFMIPQYHVVKPAMYFIRLIFILSGSVLTALILLLLVINIIFLTPLEKAYIGLEDKNLHFMNLAHEIKTPLTLIKNYLDRYISKNNLTEELSIIKQNISKLEHDMVNILDSRKLELGKNIYSANKITSFSDLLHLKQSLYEESARKKNITIDFSIQPNLLVKADPLAIERIINNLIDNAIKYTPNSGSIEVSLQEHRDKIEFEVRDTGVGISTYNLKKLYKPYSQIFNPLGSSKGVGLGLYITHSIIKELKGTMSINSILGKGSVFTVKLKPVRNKVEQEDLSFLDLQKSTENSNSVYSNDKITEPVIISGRKNILIVEDNPDLLFYIKTELEAIYNVYTADNGASGIELLCKMNTPDLILSDVMMPEMDGFQFLEYLNKNTEYKAVPLIFLSAASGHDEKIRAFHEGAVDFINKPFSIELLIARIESLINFQILKRELYEKDKYATLGMLLGGISHEIFNPLLGIYAPLENLEMLIEKSDTINHEKGQKYINNINDSVKRIENIVKSLKILYYNRNLDTENLNISEIITSIKEIFSKKLSDTITIESEIDEGFHLQGNHGSVTQILMNLISNAIDAIDGKGTIRVECHYSKKGYYMTVSDTGCGIDSDSIGNIFNAFFTTKEVGKGTGLGLYIVKDLVIRMGWKIEVTSEKNTGTTFKIIF